MTKATFTTLLTNTATDGYGNVITTSLIHQTAGLVARGSASVHADEAYLVRVQQDGFNTFHGKTYTVDSKLEALDDYNARVGTFVAVEQA